jgi:hypothetical protein
MHARLQDAVNSWYNLEEFGKHEGFVTVFSDSDDGKLPSGAVMPNVKTTGCETTYNYGLWCKNSYMWKYWREDAKFKDVEWFVRIMDDSYVHLENLLDLVEQHNSSKRIVLGDKHCYWSNHDYPSGGPGVLFSRGVLDDFNQTEWELPFKLAKNIGNFFDDVAWGDYLHFRGIPVTNHMGIEQAANRPHSPQWKYWLEFQRGKGRKWNLPYRPVLLHQHGNPMPMVEVHNELHKIDYSPTSETLIDIPACHCPPNRHQKCVWNQDLTNNGLCHWGFDRLTCIAPGPWDLPQVNIAPQQG